jgi:hypothetical protein
VLVVDVLVVGSVVVVVPVLKPKSLPRWNAQK